MNSRDLAKSLGKHLMGEFCRIENIDLIEQTFDQHAAEARAEQLEACAKNAMSKIQSPLLQKMQSKSGKLAEDWLKKLFAKGLFNEQYTNELFGAHIIELANIINSHAAEARAEQREMCAAYVSASGFNTPQGRMVYLADALNACLNATGESDGR